MKDFLLGSLQQIARPLVGMCLRHGIKLGELIDALKRVYVACAEKTLADQGDAVSISRITLMTGVHRTDVSQILEEKTFVPRERHTASDVISKWRYDPKFCSKPGKPRVLEFEGKESEFAQLVQSVSHSVSPYTVSFELERLGMITKTKDGKVKLLTRVFVPKGDPGTVLEMLAEDTEDLFHSVEENALCPAEKETPHHHLKTEYTNVPNEALPEIRSWLMREGSALHERARNFLSKFDRDLSPGLEGTGKNRVAVGSFSRVTPSNSTPVNRHKKGSKK